MPVRTTIRGMKTSGWMVAGMLAACIGNCSLAECRRHPTRRVARGHGFQPTTTTHHFYLTRTGGIIQVTATDPTNAEQISTVQMHLKHIVGMFSEGNFSIPHFVHNTSPPGAATMKRLRSSIRYTSD